MESVRTDMERKLEVVSYLRSCNEENKRKLQNVNDILYNGANIAQSESFENVKQDYEYDSIMKKTRQVSFYQRLVLAGLFLGVFWFVFRSNKIPVIEEYHKQIMDMISTDYTENIFDFIQKLPYTLTYEKTNA